MAQPGQLAATDGVSLKELQSAPPETGGAGAGGGVAVVPVLVQSPHEAEQLVDMKVLK
jgi:hypothetical protein